MHMYESLQLSPSFSNYFIKASASVSGVIGIIHTTPPAAGVLGVSLDRLFLLPEPGQLSHVADCNKHIYVMGLFLPDISDCNQKFMNPSSEHIDTVWARLISTLKSVLKTN